MPRMLTKHFSEEELRCRCGCGLCKPHPRLLALLDFLREAWGGPLIVTSGTRCRTHNRAEGGVDDGTGRLSPHVPQPRGEGYSAAADIRPANRADADRLWRATRKLWQEGLLPQLGGLGRYTGRVHVDVWGAPTKRLREWDYRGRG